MSIESAKDYQVQVVSIFALLYDVHPIPVDLDTDKILAERTELNPDILSGAILWLYRAGLLYGEYEERQGKSVLKKAQLAAAAMALLNAVNPSTQKPFGPQLVEAAASGDRRSVLSMAERVFNKLVQ